MTEKKLKKDWTQDQMILTRHRLEYRNQVLNKLFHKEFENIKLITPYDIPINQDKNLNIFEWDKVEAKVKSSENSMKICDILQEIMEENQKYINEVDQLILRSNGLVSGR